MILPFIMFQPKYKKDLFFKVNLYERSPKVLSAIGAGVAVSGGALCLDALGVGHTWNKDGVTIHQSVVVDGQGLKII